MAKRRKKIEQEHDFFYPEGKVHLYDADEFLSQVKHMMSDVVVDKEFAVYLGINNNDCLNVWVKDDEGTMYQVDTRNLDNEESEIRLTEMEHNEEDYEE